MEEIKTKLKEAITLIAEASNGLTEASDGLADDKYLELSEIRKQLEDFENNL